MARNPESVKAARRRWYKRNSERAKTKVNERRRDLREWFFSYKSDLSCSRCSEDHPSCLEFHHTDPTKKEYSVSGAITNGWSKERILKEIEKCIVLCANCHRKEHHQLKGGRT